MTSLPVQKPFPLLKLPSEIRRCIWSYIVVKDGHLIFRNYTEMTELEFFRFVHNYDDDLLHTIRDKDAEPRSMLAVAFTCRQIYLEVAPIYYGENTFCPSDHVRFAGYNDACQRFTKAIGLRNANTITDLSLHDPSCYSVDLCLMLLPHVKRLRFNRCERSQQLKDVTSLAKRHKSVTMFYGGEVWGPDKWSLYPEDT